MTSVNHTLAPITTIILHAYNFAENPRKPAQRLAFPLKTSRKFGLAALKIQICLARVMDPDNGQNNVRSETSKQSVGSNGKKKSEKPGPPSSERIDDAVIDSSNGKAPR